MFQTVVGRVLGVARCRSLFLKGLLGLCVVQMAAAHADTVWMNNGDRLTGRIERLQSKVLRLETSYGGTIDLEWDQVKRLESASIMRIQDKALRREYLARLSVVEEDTPAVVAGQDPRAAELAALEPEDTFHPLVGDAVWKGMLDVGLDRTTATTHSEDYMANLDAELRHRGWRHNVHADYIRKNDNAITTSHHYAVGVSSDRFLTDKFFWQGRALYKWDQIEDISRQAAIGTGPGYQFWDDDNGAFSLAGLLGRTRYNYNDGFSEEFYDATLRWDYQRNLGGERFVFYTRGELMRPLDGAIDMTSLDADVGIRYRLTDWLSWFLAYSRSRISGGRRELDERQISTGLGLAW